MSSILRIVRASGLAIAVALVMALPVGAAAPLRATFELDVTFQSPLWTTRCGIPVFIHIEATQTATVFYSSDGTAIIKEIDTSPGFRQTYFSPLDAGGTGNSFVDRGGGILKTYYPQGATIGAPAVLEFMGVQGFASPGHPSAGRVVVDGVVVFVSPEGIPGVDTVAPISQAGHLLTTTEAIALRCSYLNGV